MNPAEIVAAARAADLTVIGFTNHLWDSAVPGASDWYKLQDVPHVLSIRSQIPADTKGLLVLVGCETEYLGGGVLGISREAMELFDYILVPATHFHMKDYVAAAMTDCRDVALLMKQRFDEIVQLKIPNSGVAHPFLPLGYLDRIEKVMGHLSNQLLQDSFCQAAKADVSIEITTEFFPSLQDVPKSVWPDEIYIRLLSIAKEAGCKFHLASDAHCYEKIGLVNELGPILDVLNVKNKELWCPSPHMSYCKCSHF